MYKSIDRVISYYNKKTVFIEICNSTHRHRFFVRLILRLIAVWIPMVIIVLTHTVMFLKLKKEARIRSQSTSSDTSNQMQQISKTFLVTVIIFLVCLLPWSIIDCLRWKLNDDTDTEFTVSLTRMNNYSLALANLNSCLNPFIYSKIHLKIWHWMKNFPSIFFRRIPEL